jgi:outer membrane immunogenic protein
VESLSSVTGRVGYAWGRFLAYARGGAAWERDKYSATTIVLGTAYTADETRPGWTVGIGGEYAFTDFLSGFIEYGYYDFGNHRISFNPQIAGLPPAFVDVQETRSVVRAGLNFRFWSYARRSLSDTEPGFQFTELTTAERSSYFESRRSPHAA